MRRIDDFFIKLKDVAVPDRSGIGDVVDARFLLLHKRISRFEKVADNGNGIFDVDYIRIVNELGDQVPRIRFGVDRHAQPDDEDGKFIQQSVRYCFRPGIEAWGIRPVSFGEALAFIIALENATAGEMSHENISFQAGSQKHERAGDIAVQRFQLVGFAPVDIRLPCFTRRIDDAGGLVRVQIFGDSGRIADVSEGNDRPFAEIGLIFIAEPAVAKDDYFRFHIVK